MNVDSSRHCESTADIPNDREELGTLSWCHSGQQKPLCLSVIRNPVKGRKLFHIPAKLEWRFLDTGFRRYDTVRHNVAIHVYSNNALNKKTKENI